MLCCVVLCCVVFFIVVIIIIMSTTADDGNVRFGPPKPRYGGQDLLNNEVGRFLDAELPWVTSMLRKGIDLVKHPPMKQVKIISAVALALGVIVSFLPVRTLHYLNGTHWSKLYGLFMDRRLVRMVVDGIHRVLCERFPLLYLLIKLAFAIALFPVVILWKAFGNLSRVRVVVILATTPGILSWVVFRALASFQPTTRDAAGAEDGLSAEAAPPKRSSSKVTVLQAMLPFALMIAFAVYLDKRHQVIYRFCFDEIKLRALVFMLVAIAVYVQLSTIVYVDLATAGRVAGAPETAASAKEVEQKTRQMTVLATLAAVVGTYLTMAMNPGYFARFDLVSPAAVKLE